MRWRVVASCPAATPTCDPDSNPTPFVRDCVVQHHVGLMLRHPVPLLLMRPVRLLPQHPARLLLQHQVLLLLLHPARMMLQHQVWLLLLHPARMLQQQPVTPNPSFPCGGVLQHPVRLLQHQPVTTTLTMTPSFMCVSCLRRFLVSSLFTFTETLSEHGCGSGLTPTEGHSARSAFYTASPLKNTETTRKSLKRRIKRILRKVSSTCTVP